MSDSLLTWLKENHSFPTLDVWPRSPCFRASGIDSLPVNAQCLSPGPDRATIPGEALPDQVSHWGLSTLYSLSRNLFATLQISGVCTSETNLSVA